MLKHLFSAGLFAALMLSSAQAREITHAMGVTEVPDQPQRVVILTNEGTEALLHLGVVPVGAAQSWDVDPFYDHLVPLLGDAVSLGTETAINLELVASLEPDLIIGTKVRQEKIYEQLSAIAPTVMSETIGESWLKNYQFYGEVLGLGDKAAANVAALEVRAKELAAAIGDGVNEEISLVRFSPSRTRLYFRGSFPGVVLDLVGFKRPPAQDHTETFTEVQKERIPEMAGDRIFYFSSDNDNSEDKANMDEWLADPLWLNLEAVKAGKAQRVGELAWNAGGGIYCAYMMLDDLADIYGVTLPPLGQ
ncbi:iron-siderophore ABC transporter substrate-binding protein [Devosia neptuniae]|uniref:Iron-siderophore ABC transporter substrate-binding protein n=1 Tax=Devosia neptuniae TaxID=191302 RepID=A0ABY6CF04_9HYPH|nr:iron-siderophore ABC transporter substrate-binding protein [Devosia neptuniae]UXN70822.1 iron-siderophore ABC transporter substrate-binding protein [Devosia neptuniae]